MSDNGKLVHALDARFFAPLRRPRTRRVGVVLEKAPIPHGNEYIYNQNDYRMVYMDFARL